MAFLLSLIWSIELAGEGLILLSTLIEVGGYESVAFKDLRSSLDNCYIGILLAPLSS